MYIENLVKLLICLRLNFCPQDCEEIAQVFYLFKYIGLYVSGVFFLCVHVCLCVYVLWGWEERKGELIVASEF